MKRLFWLCIVVISLLSFTSECMEEQESPYAEFESMSREFLQRRLGEIQQQIQLNQSEIQAITNRYNQNNKKFISSEDEKKYDVLVDENTILKQKKGYAQLQLQKLAKESAEKHKTKAKPSQRRRIKKLSEAVEKAKAEQAKKITQPELKRFDEETVILKELDELEKQYDLVVAEFDMVVQAGIQDKERFDALLQEGDAIFNQKQKLNAKLQEISQRPGGFPGTITVPINMLLVKESGAKLIKTPEQIEKTLRQMLVRYKDLVNIKKGMTQKQRVLMFLKELTKN